MGLFINKNEHPDVFKTNHQLKEPNQVYSRRDFLTDLMNEQEKANKSLKQALNNLHVRTIHQEEAQDIHWKKVDDQLNDLKNSNLQQKDMEDQMMKSLLSIHEKNAQLEAILEKESVSRSSLTDQVSQLNKSYQEIASRLERSEETNQKLALKMQEQLELQKETAEKITKQEEFHGGVLERLDTQEALLDKIARQVNHIRSILFERTNYLAEKIDDGYKLTSSYVYKLMTGSDQPLTFFLLNHKKEEKHDELESVSQKEGSPLD